MRGWGVPIVGAIVLHLLLISLLLMGWDSAAEFKPVKVPQHIQAKVVELKPKKKVVKKVNKPTQAKRSVNKPTPKKATEVKPTKVKPTTKVQPKKAPEKPVVTTKPPPPKKVDPPPEKPKVDEQKLQAERQRLAELHRLQALADALALEEQKQKTEQERIQVQSYLQQIRADIESKWSRPPSARNGMQVTLTIQLVPSGEVIAVEIVKRSGNDAFDTSAVNAVHKVQVFSVPEEYELFDKYFRKMTVPFRAEGLSR